MSVVILRLGGNLMVFPLPPPVGNYNCKIALEVGLIKSTPVTITTGRAVLTNSRKVAKIPILIIVFCYSERARCIL